MTTNRSHSPIDFWATVWHYNRIQRTCLPGLAERCWRERIRVITIFGLGPKTLGHSAYSGLFKFSFCIRSKNWSLLLAISSWLQLWYEPADQSFSGIGSFGLVLAAFLFDPVDGRPAGSVRDGITRDTQFFAVLVSTLHSLPCASVAIRSRYKAAALLLYRSEIGLFQSQSAVCVFLKLNRN